MSEHMTAEQLREQIRNVALYARTKHCEVADAEAGRFSLTAVANSLDQLAARLSGMAAVPDGYALVPIRATDEMIQSFHLGAMNAAPDGDYHGKPTVSVNARCRAGYAALLFAAPEPPHA